MSEVDLVAVHKHAPQPIYLKNYQAPTYFIDETKLTFDLHDDYAIVTSKLRVRHNRSNKHLAQDLILNGEALTLISVHLDERELSANDYELTDTLLIIRRVPENFQLDIVTKIYPQNNTALSGLYRSRDTYCTQCEAEGFRRITYFLDHPDVLSRYTTTIQADKKRYPYLLSNGNLIDSGELPDNRHFATWEDPFKKPSYLFALVAGDFDLVENTFTTQSGRDILIHVFVEKGYGDQADHAVYSLQEAMRWDESAYGREYDLDIYMIVAIGDFNMGAMENKGLNIFNTKYILAKPTTATDDDYIHILSVVGHEYFHNWSGNRVTCRDWFQLSLKEGLTIFRDQSFTEDLLSHAVMRIRDVNALRESQFPEDAGPLAHPVRPDSYIEINNFYTATIYNKGAEVLRMLQTILGPVCFRKGMDLYFARHDGHAVTIEDYVKIMEDVSGIDLSQFRLWYSQAGTPEVTVTDHYDSNSQTYTLTMRQNCPPTPQQLHKKPMFIPIKMGLLNENGDAIALDQTDTYEKVLCLTEAEQQFEFKHITTKPIPSLLRNFSAPIILDYPYSDASLRFLFKHDQDAFNRWEAGHKYDLHELMHLIHAHAENKSLQFNPEWSSMYDYILHAPNDDLFLLAEMLYLPSENYIGEQMEIAAVDAIHAARQFARIKLAEALQKVFLEHYERYHQADQDYVFNMQAVGARQFKNACLGYLMLLPQYHEKGMQQFKAALNKNMTDAQAALVALNNVDSPLRDEALSAFYNAWQKDALVVDKWFAIQSQTILPNALQQVKKLYTHPAFDLKNPNKVYALIGGFGNRNPSAFHQKDGEGYQFLTDVVYELDQLNPQVAARMVKPLTTWRRYDKERQTLMQKQLERLLHHTKISRDLYELVSKSLGEG